MASFFSNVFGRHESQDAPPASVLAEWEKYSAESAGPSQSDRLLNTMEQGSSKVQGFVSSSLNRVTTGVQGVGSSVGSGIASVQMPSTSQFTWFAALLAAGGLFLVLAFTLFLPVIIIAPSKFAVSFTVGSGFIMAAFVALKGWRGQVLHMFSRGRLPFTIGYLGSMGGTLYAGLAMHSYVLSLVCCAAQVVALLYYTLSYFPGGTLGVKFVMTMLLKSCMQCVDATQKTIFR